MRQQVACYGAVIAIILEQLNAYPRSTITETPNPLVRIREQPVAPDEWHPDELITRSTGRRDVLVWDAGSERIESPGANLLSN